MLLLLPLVGFLVADVVGGGDIDGRGVGCLRLTLERLDDLESLTDLVRLADFDLLPALDLSLFPLRVGLLVVLGSRVGYLASHIIQRDIR